MQFKIIHTALAPNYTWREVAGSLAMLIFPWNWPRLRRGQAIGELERRFEDRLGAKYTLAVGSGREALQFLLHSLALPEGSEILVQSFTCMVVVNAILWAGYKPVYLDIDETYNLDWKDMEKKISGKTRAVIVQHTFGIPANLEKISRIANEHKLLLIEDCAHALGAKYKDREVGTFGDLSFFSFGRSKVISSVNGGLLAVNNSDLLPLIMSGEKRLNNWPLGRILQNLLHAPVTSMAKTFYFSPLGKLIMVIAQKLKLINLEVTPSEKKSLRPSFFPSRMANAMAILALGQLRQLDNFNELRRKASLYYDKHLKLTAKIDPHTFSGAIFLRYPIQVENPAQLLKQARRQGVILGDWYSTPIAPADVDQSKTGYLRGSCPNCERINKRIINLPTHHDLRLKDLSRIVQIVNTHA